jgi:S-methylmethionine-dependent homocysteine/selenocysteine methylase
MPRFRENLPQLSDKIFVTDGGIETTLVFKEGLELPEFAAFHLLRSDAGRKSLNTYFMTYAEMARRHGLGLILESPTWRANPDWGKKLGYDGKALAKANRESIDILTAIRTRFSGLDIVISGNIGPRGDGYVPGALMQVSEAAEYHGEQIRTFAGTEADMVAAFTMNYVEEAIGVSLAARNSGMPVAISFTVETDGKLPTGQTLQEAIEATDAATGRYPAYYMINCAHPTHFLSALRKGEPWISRLRGLRANASTKSHAELNEATVLDDGNPLELSAQYREVRNLLTELRVVGGCCGTDDRHVEEICRALAN